MFLCITIKFLTSDETFASSPLLPVISVKILVEGIWDSFPDYPSLPNEESIVVCRSG